MEDSAKICSKISHFLKFKEHLHFITPLDVEAVVQWCSIKKVLLEISQNSQINTCARVSFLIKLQIFIKKETLAQLFSCEFGEISKNTLLYRRPLVPASLDGSFWCFLTKLIYSLPAKIQKQGCWLRRLKLFKALKFLNQWQSFIIKVL